MNPGHNSIFLLVVFAGILVSASGMTGSCTARTITANIGDSIEFNGTVPLADMVYLFVTGPGMPKNGAPMANSNAAVVTGEPTTFTQVLVQDDRWQYTWDTGRVSGGLAPGTYTVFISTQPAAADALSGVTYGEVEVRLSRLPATGTLIVRSMPEDAQVYLDGKFSGLTPRTIPGLSPGSYSLRVEMSGYLPANDTAEVIAGESAELLYTLAPVIPATRQETITHTATPLSEKQVDIPATSTGFPVAGSLLGILFALMLILKRTRRYSSAPKKEGSFEDTGQTG